MNATGPYLSNKKTFKQKYCLGKKWEQFQCGDTDPEAPGSRGLGGLDWGWIGLDPDNLNSKSQNPD